MTKEAIYSRMLFQAKCNDATWKADSGNAKLARMELAPFPVDISGDIAQQIIEGLEKTIRTIEANVASVREAVAKGTFGQ